MKHLESTFAGKNNHPLYYQSWLPSQDPKAVIALAHGFGEHSGRYQNVTAALVSQGYAIYAYDQRGHGQTAGQRGYIDDWDDFRTDLKNFIQLAKEQHPNIPLFLYGHSMGGLVVFDYTLHHHEHIQAVLTTGPLLATPGVSPILIFLARVLDKIMPKMALNTNLDIDALSRDLNVGKAYADDPLVHGKSSARLGNAILERIKWVQANAGKFPSHLPLLILHGEADTLSPAHGSATLFQSLTIAGKTRITYPDARHELHNEINKEEVLADIHNWLEKHL